MAPRGRGLPKPSPECQREACPARLRQSRRRTKGADDVPILVGAGAEIVPSDGRTGERVVGSGIDRMTSKRS
jgi:hypothetical protein